jgi:hypothetical protein
MFASTPASPAPPPRDSGPVREKSLGHALPKCKTSIECYNSVALFARKLKVDVVVCGERRPCPLDWLDSFAMANFTRPAPFDDTLPIGEGALEAGFSVDLEQLAAAMSEWFTGRGMGNGRPVKVEVRPA